MSDRAKAYRVFGDSTASYLAQVRWPDWPLIRADRAALAMLLAAPMHAMGPGLMPHLRALGGRLCVPEIEVLSEAASLRCLARHPCLLTHSAEIAVAREADDAPLVPRRSEWTRNNCLGHMRRAAELYGAMPPRVWDADLQRAL